MVDFTDLDINKLERLQIEGKLTEEELKDIIGMTSEIWLKSH